MNTSGSHARALRRSTATLVAVVGLALVPRVGAAQMWFTRATIAADSARKPKRDTVVVKRDSTARKPKAPTFAELQQGNERVLNARIEKRFELKKQFRDRGLTYPAAETFLRIFKRERVLEVWVRSAGREDFALFKSYPVCALAGQLGPKRTQGDGQTPEGFYTIDAFNPSSDYHLSLRIDYPNRSDQMISNGERLGGDIFIHGGCKTEGCMAVTDDAIKELYWLAVEARTAGQMTIPVHIFPARLTDAEMDRLTQLFGNNADLKSFWASLKPGFDYFETQHKLPIISVDPMGRYRMQAPARRLAAPTVPMADTAVIFSRLEDDEDE